MAKVVNPYPRNPETYPVRHRKYTKTDYTTSGSNFVVLDRDSLGYDPGGAFCIHDIYVDTAAGTWGLDVLAPTGEEYITLDANTVNADSSTKTYKTRGYRAIRVSFSAAYTSEATIIVRSTYAGLGDA